MTTVVMRWAHDRPGGVAAREVVATWTPTRRRTSDGGVVVLPDPMHVRGDSPLVVQVAATGPGWCWRVVERVRGGGVRHVLVPDDVGEVEYAALVEVDPGTLEPAAEPEAAWWAALETGPASVTAGAVLAHGLVGGVPQITVARSPWRLDGAEAHYDTSATPVGDPAWPVIGADGSISLTTLEA